MELAAGALSSLFTGGVVLRWRRQQGKGGGRRLLPGEEAGGMGCGGGGTLAPGLLPSRTAEGENRGTAAASLETKALGPETFFLTYGRAIENCGLILKISTTSFILRFRLYKL